MEAKQQDFKSVFTLMNIVLVNQKKKIENDTWKIT